MKLRMNRIETKDLSSEGYESIKEMLKAFNLYLGKIKDPEYPNEVLIYVARKPLTEEKIQKLFEITEYVDFLEDGKDENGI